MSYVALYRAYRPQLFDEVVDQKAIVKTLENAITNDKVAHAYLFCGPRGTGKTTLAKIFAKALNCYNGPTTKPCLECESCKAILQGTNPDVIEIDAASNNGADDIRALRDSVRFLPSMSKYKVYIIDEVHMLSNAAFNALLKTLEEPPKYVVFILCTTEPYKIPETILSRCQRFDFKAISDEGIINRLELISKEENISISKEAIEEITNLAEGGMRDALSLLDQVISFVDNKEITLNDVYEVSGNVSNLDLLNLLNLIINNESEKAINMISNLYNKGKEIPKIADDLMLFLRDILLYKSNIFDSSKQIYKTTEFSNTVDKIGKTLIFSWLDELNNAINQMKFSNQKRSYLDLCIIKMADSVMQKENSILDQIKYLESQISNMQAELNKRPVKEEIKVVPTNIAKLNKIDNKENDEVIKIEEINEILNNASKETKEKFNKEWPLLKIKYQDILAISILQYGKVVAVSDKAIIFVLQDEGFCNRVMKYENYIQMYEIIHKQIDSIEKIITLPQKIWKQIVTDYKNKYESGIEKPILNNIMINVKRPVKKEEIKVDDPVLTKLNDLFGDKLEIKE